MPAHLYRLISRAYDMIGDLTPIQADCGKLCGAACCEGDDYGMLLFPGEAVRLANVPGFRVSRIKYMDGREWLLSCSGACEREYRPLSCRIFPLAPHVDKNGRVSTISDPRAKRMCPLSGGNYLDARFRKAVSRALSMLSKDPAMMNFMQMISDDLDGLQMLV